MPANLPIDASNLLLVESLYERYQQDPESVSPQWRRYFTQMEGGSEAPATARTEIPCPPESEAYSQQISVLQLINAYRFRGHGKAHLDPLEQHHRPELAELTLADHDLSERQLQQLFNTGSLVAPETCTLADIVTQLEKAYCGSIGSEYMHITETTEKRWIQQRLESDWVNVQFSMAMRLHILERLFAANGLEQFLHTKYVGQKRFSLEGGESLIPLLDELVQHSGKQGVKEIILGMAHRGRLNVLVNVLGKRPSELFSEFEGNHAETNGSGDVKYHQGFSSDLETEGGPVHLAMAFNPSHLEIINPVVEGSVRARQERRSDSERVQVLPVLLHGDAALSGQGVVMETLNLSQTRGYSTGGTVHIVVNNQIGFTTSDPLDARSSSYCSDVAKMVQAPIFHVNGDDPEAVIFITRVALDYRRKFKKDVFIDMVCYRRHGHSEADEPAATQPLMYQKIRSHDPVHILYRDRLIGQDLVSLEKANRMQAHYEQRLLAGEVVSRPILTDFATTFAADWSRFIGTDWDRAVNTGVALSDLSRLLYKLIEVPENFHLHRSVRKINSDRLAMANGDQLLDWGAAELLAYATLLESGYPVRLSGQDSGRGTFFHRHAVLHNQADGECYIPLRNLSDDQPHFLVIDSMLSEEAVLGFELGYTAADPHTLVIWEAQFGDFANNAQVVIDQFISSSEAKWQRFSGLVMFLPHSYDGQGPEHSSARLERYLQLCAENNMQVCYPSTPAQMFHMLRRQMLQPFRRPLIVMTPKSLLRHKQSKSALEELASGGFQSIIDDPGIQDPAEVEHVLLCSGKVYFDLMEARDQRQVEPTAIVRMEQLYPFPDAAIDSLLHRYSHVRVVRWVQEEPWNQGAWFYIHPNLKTLLHPNQTLDCATRPPSASPAVGYLHKHLAQQHTLIDKALDFSNINSRVSLQMSADMQITNSKERPS